MNDSRASDLAEAFWLGADLEDDELEDDDDFDDEYDDDDDDTCEHGIGFDEDCPDCPEDEEL